MKSADVSRHYTEQGFVRLDEYFDQAEVAKLRAITEAFHQRWLADHRDIFECRAINSNGLTAPGYLSETQRLSLFRLISSNKLLNIVRAVVPGPVFFMNTQLFFDPFNPQQANYWHRDGQYHMTLEQQKEALSGPEVLHLRLALKDEPGIEVVPGSHRQWDSDRALNVRLKQAGCSPSDDLENGEEIPLKSGDMLLFSANMLHRGLYGKDRMALDFIYAEVNPELNGFWLPQYMPPADRLSQFDYPEVFHPPGGE